MSDVETSPDAERLTRGKLRGEVQLEVFRAKLVMARARELMEALLAVASRRRD